MQALHLTFGLWFAEIFIFAAWTVLGWQVVFCRPWRAMGLTRFEPKSFALGVAFGLVNYAAWAIPTMAAAHAVFPKKVIEIFDSARIFERQTTVELWLIVLGVSIAAPLGEELFFRGLMQRGLELYRPAPRAIVLTAFIFSAFHLDPVGLVSRFELGVLFGLLAWHSGSLWPAMGAHAANNAISSLLFLASRGSATEDESLPWHVAVGLFVIGNALLVLLVKFAGPKLRVAEPAEVVEQPRASFFALVGPWAIGALASIVLLVAIDRRGVALNVTDALAKAPDSVRKRPDVVELRAKVRRGDAELSEYRALLEDPARP